jgi:peptide/nickel transport system permease protein
MLFRARILWRGLLLLNVVEFFFAYKGFGALLLEACLNQDIYLIEACTSVAVCVAVGTQTLADVGYTYLNPRLHYEI